MSNLNIERRNTFLILLELLQEKDWEAKTVLDMMYKPECWEELICAVKSNPNISEEEFREMLDKAI